MDKTGAGYDRSAFISYGAAQEMSEDERNKITFPYKIDESTASMIMVKLKEGTDPIAFKASFEEKYNKEEILAYSVTSKVADFYFSFRNG